MLKLNLAHQTEIYVSDAGYLVIKQESLEDGNQNIILSPEQTTALAKFIEKNFEEQKELWINSLEQEDE